MTAWKDRIPLKSKQNTILPHEETSGTLYYDTTIMQIDAFVNHTFPFL